MTHTFIIAEAGINHNGSLDLAYKLVDAAIVSGADAVKFQTFKAEHLVTKTAAQAQYQSENMAESVSQFEMLKSLELTFDEFTLLKEYCDKRGIQFLSTPFDHDSIDFLIETLKLPLMKVPSGELTNAPYLYQMAKYDVDVILSTGMATVEEIHDALAFLAYGYSKQEVTSIEQVRDYYSTKEAKEYLQKHVKILHCTSEYPTPYPDVNLYAMDKLCDEFRLPIGLSDHSEGITVPIAAVARGAVVIEKHFTLDKEMQGPDHKASLNPIELKEMVEAIRQTEQCLGNKDKLPTTTEQKNKLVARKSLVALKPIVKGEIFTLQNLGMKRPGTGIDPLFFWDYLGQPSSENYEVDEAIRS